MNVDEKELFQGLQALSDSAFPKRCSTCGREYLSPEDFFRSSRSLNNSSSGLKPSLGDEDEPIVEVFRNCHCGSTLMDFFEDRRDTSAKGLKRRDVFGRMLILLQQRGLGSGEARQELIGLMNGRASEKIEALGIQLNPAGTEGDGRSPER